MSPEEADQRTEPVSGNSSQSGGEPPPTNLFLYGFLSLFICHPMGFVVWIAGNKYLTKCRELGVEPNSQAVAGRMLGKISAIFTIVVIVAVPLGLIAMSIVFSLEGDN